MNNNNKKRIFIAILFLIILFLLLTFAGGRSEVALVEFFDGFDNSLIDSQEVEIGGDAIVPENPKHKNYVFAGWFLYEDHDIKVTDFTDIEEDLKVIALYAGDANNNGIADENDEKFVVTFKDGFTGDVLKTESVLVGMNATAPNVPTHRGYTFVGWDKGYTNIVKDTTVTAEYERNDVVVTVYTVTFIDGDTNEVITTQKVQEGNAATLPEAPKHENRVFVEWNGNYSNIKEDTTVVAVYADDKNNDGVDDETQPHYDITYVDYNEEVLEVIEDVLVDMPTPVIANPEREYYKFEGWNPEVAETVTDNATYMATYSPINDENQNDKADEEEEHFTITYLDYNDEIIKVFENVLVDVETPTVEDPTREYYTFAGWNPEVAETVSGEATYKATYTINNDENGDNIPDETQDRFDVVYKDFDGSIIKEYNDVLVDMETPVVENPSREFYTFTGWNPEVAETVTEDVVYTATYRANKDANNNGTADEEETLLIVEFVDGLTNETIKSEEVLPGLDATAPVVPTHENYVFTGWDKEFTNVTTDLIVTAQYADDKNNNDKVDSEEAHYDITYVDYNDEVIKVFKDVLVGLDTPTIDNPTREYYTFAGWNPEVSNTVNGEVTYKATYTINNDENGNNVPDEIDTKYTVTYKNHIGEVLFREEVLINMPTPKIDKPERENYIFIGWNPFVAAKVTKNVTYNPVYEPINDKNKDGIADEEQAKYDVIYLDEDGTELYSSKVLVDMKTPTISNPTKEYYTFAGWNPSVAATVTENATYTATYTINNDENGNKIPDELENKYTVTYTDHEGNVLFQEKVLVNLPTPKFDAPVREFYKFVKWNPNVAETVTKDVTYKATYVPYNDENRDFIADEEQAKYTVIYVDDEGKELFNQKVLVNMPTPKIDNPVKPYYTFTGWTPKVAKAVTEDVTYTATFEINNDENGNKIPDELENKYTVTYTDHEGNVLFQEKVLVNLPTPKFEAPVREYYKFVKWNPNVEETVTKDVTYKATYVPINDENRDFIADEEQAKYTVIYVDDEGKELFNQKVLVNMPTPKIDNPVKPYYTFTGWTPKVAKAVTEDVTYTATFEINNDENGNKIPDELENKYTVTYTDHEGNVLFQEKVLVNLPTPKFDAPVREFYKFVKWNPNVAETVTKDVTYKATYVPYNDENRDFIADEEQAKYTVIYVDDEGKELFNQKVLVNMPTPKIDNPVKPYYTFTGWTPKVAKAVTENVTYTATFKANNDKNNNGIADEEETLLVVEFVDGLTSATIDKVNVLPGLDATAPAVPTHENYVFIGWDSVFTNVTTNLIVTAVYTEDSNNNGIADKNETLLVVEFVDGLTSETIKTEEVLPGLNATAPVAPTHKDYVFTGWDKEFTNITSNLTVTAKYADDKNNNGKVDSTEEYFTVIYKDHNGNELYNKEILVDMPTPKIDDPIRENYEFIGWNPLVAATVTKNVTYKPIFEPINDQNKDGIADEEQDKFTVIYVDDNGKKLFDEKVLVNMPTPKITDPVKPYYTFTGWNPEVAKRVTANAIYTATFKANNDKNNNGTADEEETLLVVEFVDGLTNETIDVVEVLPGLDATAPVAPTHKDYVFTGWDKEFTNITSDLTVTAKYADDKNNNGEVDSTETLLVVEFIDGLTSETIKTEEVLSGLNATAPVVPTHKDYVFIGWDKEFTNITSDLTVTAEYADDKNNNGKVDSTEEYFTVIYQDHNGNELYNKEILIDMPTPKFIAPEREYYKFSNWTPSVAETVTKDATYKAVYVPINDENKDFIADEEQAKYTVIYVDDEGKELHNEKVLVNMPTPKIDNPVKPYYTFTGWTPKVAKAVTKDVTYTATFKANNDENNNGTADEEETLLVVEFVDGLTSETIKTEEVLPGLDATAPAAPAHRDYVFTGWDKEFSNVTTDLTITAKYAADKNNNGVADSTETLLVVEFVDGLTNETIKSEEVLPGLDATAPAAPTHRDYVFTGWDKEFSNVTTDLTVTAKYAADKNNNGTADKDELLLTVEFVDGISMRTIKTEEVLSGLDATAPVAPKHENYVFIGWDKEFTNVTTNLTVTAEYAKDDNNNGIADSTEEYFDVKFVDSINGEQIGEVQNILINMNAVAPEAPKHKNYVFTGWDKEFTNVTGDLTVNALYADDKNNNGEVDSTEEYFTVIYKDFDGEELYSEEVLVDMPTPSIANPTRKYYTFNGWNPKVNPTVTKDVTYTATYKANNDLNGNGKADEEETLLIVEFVDGLNSQIIDTQNVLPGLDATAPVAPVHTGYVFTGWDKEFTNVTTNLTVTAVYAEDKNGDQIPDSEQVLYEVKFFNGNTQIGNVQYVVEGEDAVAPANPTKNGYSFNGWDKEFTNVTSNLNVNATFVDDIAPAISTSVSLNKEASEATINVTATDAGTGVKVIKWLEGEKEISDFASAGNNITSSKKFTTDVNGKFTIYAEDNAGNSSVKVIEVLDVVFVPGDDFLDEYVKFSAGRLNGLYNTTISLTAKNDTIKIKNIRIYRSEDSLLQAGCELFGICATKSRYATMEEIQTGASVPKDMEELNINFTQNGISSLDLSTDSPDRFTIYVEVEYKGQIIKRLYKFRLAYVVGQ